jgi:DNA-binding response OmpR family regulator
MANSGPDTILLLRGVQPPVAVVDVNMDGLEVLALIRAESLPVRTIFLTTQSQENEILRGFSLGAEDYLLQPYSPVELVARLKRLLG